MFKLKFKIITTKLNNKLIKFGLPTVMNNFVYIYIYVNKDSKLAHD